MNFLTNWFHYGPLPSNRLEGHYVISLVILSYVVAVLASYVTLTLVARLREETDKKIAFYWLMGGAFTMGAGIWSMHFIGMLAFILPMPMEYEATWTVASLLMAMLASGFALFILQNKYSYSSLYLFLGGLAIGMGIASMHYMGMEGMKYHVNIRYLPSLFFLSVLIGIVAAEAALWFALESHRTSKRQIQFKIISAMVMGFAICGMHYTGMSASIFTGLPKHSMPGISETHLAFFIAMIMAFIFTLALTVSSYYKKMIDAIQNEKEFLNAMLDNLKDGIIACNEKGEITVLNNTLQKSLPIDKWDKITTVKDLYQYYPLYVSDSTLIAPEDYPLNCVLRGEVIKKLPLILKCENAQNRDVIIDGQPIINKDKKFLGGVIVLHDVTQLKIIEKLKTEFITMVSHELRTPLTSMSGSLALLETGFVEALPEKAKKLVAIANTNCERLIILTNDILDMEKIEAGAMVFQFENTNLDLLIRDAIEANKMYAKKYGVTLKLIQKNKGLIVCVDSKRLTQVLANLLSNACKFSPPHQKVVILVEKIKNKVRVSVIDKGPGIPPHFQQRIFHKFSQADTSSSRETGGTGLGLHISKNIIEKMGGVLHFTSGTEGSNFYFDLSLISVLSPNRNGS